MQTVRVVVSGVGGSGKTTFVRAISEVGLVSTERCPAGEGTSPHAKIVVDFGRVAMAPDLVLHLFGVPALQAFDLLWWIHCAEAVGWVILVDSTRPETFRDALKIADFAKSFRDTPCVIVANKQDAENAWGPEELRLALRLPTDVPVLPCVATDRDSVKNVLLELLYLVLQATAC